MWLASLQDEWPSFDGVSSSNVVQQRAADPYECRSRSGNLAVGLRYASINCRQTSVPRNASRKVIREYNPLERRSAYGARVERERLDRGKAHSASRLTNEHSEPHLIPMNASGAGMAERAPRACARFSAPIGGTHRNPARGTHVR